MTDSSKDLYALTVGETAVLEGKLKKIFKLLIAEKTLKQETYDSMTFIQSMDFLANEYCRTAAEKFYLRALFSLFTEEERARVLKSVKNFKGSK